MRVSNNPKWACEGCGRKAQKVIHVSGTTRSKLTDEVLSRLRGARVVECTTLVIANERELIEEVARSRSSPTTRIKHALESIHAFAQSL